MSVDVQAVLKKVIEAGYYWSRGHGYSCEYMCNALSRAVYDTLISCEEFEAALDAVHGYVALLGGKPHKALRPLLLGAFPEEFEAHPEYRDGNLTRLYLNWADRPMPKETV